MLLSVHCGRVFHHLILQLPGCVLSLRQMTTHWEITAFTASCACNMTHDSCLDRELLSDWCKKLLHSYSQQCFFNACLFLTTCVSPLLCVVTDTHQYQTAALTRCRLRRGTRHNGVRCMLFIDPETSKHAGTQGHVSLCGLQQSASYLKYPVLDGTVSCLA